MSIKYFLFLFFFFDKTARFIHYCHKNISYISLFEYYKPLVSCSTGRVLGTQPWTIVANSDIQYLNLEDLSVLATNTTPIQDQGVGYKMWSRLNIYLQEWICALWIIKEKVWYIFIAMFYTLNIIIIWFFTFLVMMYIQLGIIKAEAVNKINKYFKAAR